ncbi:hypothetical protein LB505_010114 [Fusarium chuoi]|nr:hypothetical protein LB505_010114 [Fusarium chuoi]
MEFSSAFTFRQQPQENQESTSAEPIPVPSPGIHCPHFAGFIAVSFANGHNTIGLQPVISNAAPTFQDVSLGGGSFDVRKFCVICRHSLGATDLEAPSCPET